MITEVDENQMNSVGANLAALPSSNEEHSGNKIGNVVMQ